MLKSQVIAVVSTFLACTILSAEESELESRACPDFVVRMADEHIESLSERPQDEIAARRSFCEMFLWAYKRGVVGRVDNARFPEFAGLNAGIQYRQQHPNSTHQVLTAFGYSRIRCTGTWRTGFETSVFRRAGNRNPQESWWLAAIGGCKECQVQRKRLPKLESDQSIPEKLRRLIDQNRGRESHVQIAGYLSPKGEYGHLGFFDHEFLAVEISSATIVSNEDRKLTSIPLDDGYRSYDGQPLPTEITKEP